jgi:hypothetical protein
MRKAFRSDLPLRNPDRYLVRLSSGRQSHENLHGISRREGLQLKGSATEHQAEKGQCAVIESEHAQGEVVATVHAHHVFDGHVVTGRVRGAPGIAPEHLARIFLDRWPSEVEQSGVQRGPIRLRTIPCKPETGLC